MTRFFEDLSALERLVESSAAKAVVVADPNAPKLPDSVVVSSQNKRSKRLPGPISRRPIPLELPDSRLPIPRIPIPRIPIELPDVVVLQSVPREQLSVPISLGDRITDQVLFESAAEPAQKFYLPRYRLAEESVSGQSRYRIVMEPAGQAWTLTVYLQAYPAPETLTQPPVNTPLKHEVTVILSYWYQGQSVAQEFQEITYEEGQLVKAVLRLNSLELRDTIYQVLTHSENQAALTVQRQVQAAIATGHSTSALRLDGGNSYVNFPLTTGSQIGSAVTLEAWVNLENAAANQKIVGKSNTRNGYVLGVVDNQLYAEIWDTQGTNHVLKAGLFDSKTWTHLAVTWTSSGAMIGYINGVEVGRIPTSAQGIGRSSAALTIGVAPWNVLQWRTQGLIKEIRIWQVARSAAQIKASLHQLSGSESGLIGYWPATEGSGSAIADRTTNAQHGTLRGNAQWLAPVPLYRAVTETVPDVVDQSFFFPTILHGYIFAGIQSSLGNTTGLKRFQVNNHAYYQDVTMRQRFYYLPDQFEIGRRETGEPTLSLQFLPNDQSWEAPNARLDYYARPVVSADRLQAAAPTLRQQAALPSGDLEFMPLQSVKSLQFRLALPTDDRFSALDQLRQARVSLRDGILDSLLLSFSDFQTIWDALFSTRQEQSLLTGQVTVELANLEAEQIPCRIRLIGDPEELWQTVLDPNQRADYTKTIQVKAFRTLFDPPLDRPQDQIQALLVDFERGDTVELNADQLNASVELRLPIQALVLRHEDSGSYRYKVQVIRRGGKSSVDTEWRQTSFETLYPDVEV